MSSFGPHFNIIGICYYPNVLKEEKKNKYATHKTFMKTHINISYDIISVNLLIFEIQGNRWEFSMMRISYKLTKRTTKTEKLKIFENVLYYKRYDYSL